MALVERAGRFLGFTQFVTVATDSNEVVMIPPLQSGQKVPVGAIPGSNTANVHHTLSSDADVIADTATWKEWACGPVTETTHDYLEAPATALKLSAAGGTCTFEIVL